MDIFDSIVFPPTARKLTKMWRWNVLVYINEDLKCFILSQLTCTDSDCLHKLFPPGVCSNNQRQVGLLNELVNGALQIRQTRHTLEDQLELTAWDRVTHMNLSL